MKRWLARQLFGERPSPQYAVLGVREPQSLVTVTLTGCGEPVDVTQNNVTVSLRPMLVATVLPASGSNGVRRRHRAVLEFRERGGSGLLLGRIGLRPQLRLPMQGEDLHIFSVGWSENRCVAAFRRFAHEALWRWAARGRSRESHGVKLRQRDFRSFLVFYTCPRPVALVSVGDETGCNIFPMDLMGRAGASHSLFALRSTTPAVEVISATRRLTVSAIPLDQRDRAYALGRNHRVPYVDPAEWPFESPPSPAFSLPAAPGALRVTDFEVVDSLEPGSHTVFVARPVAERGSGEGLRLCHVQGFVHERLSPQ